LDLDFLTIVCLFRVTVAAGSNWQWWPVAEDIGGG